jgi:putative flippase GtrA
MSPGPAPKLPANPQDPLGGPPGQPPQHRVVSPIGRVIRSLAVSGVTTVLSLSILAVLIRFDLTSPAVANVISTVAGIGPSFALNRRWAWRGQGRGHVTREIAPFWAYSLLSLVLSTIAVAGAAAWADSMGASAEMRTFVVLAANVATFGTLWIGQFLLLDRVLFRHHRLPALALTAVGAGSVGVGSVGVELDGGALGDVRCDALADQRPVQRVVPVGDVVIDVGEVGHDDEVEVALVDADVVAEPVVADAGDGRREPAERLAEGRHVGASGPCLPTEHHDMADHPSPPASPASSSATSVLGATRR